MVIAVIADCSSAGAILAINFKFHLLAHHFIVFHNLFNNRKMNNNLKSKLHARIMYLYVPYLVFLFLCKQAKCILTIGVQEYWPSYFSVDLIYLSISHTLIRVYAQARVRNLQLYHLEIKKNPIFSQVILLFPSKQDVVLCNPPLIAWTQKN